MSLIYGVMEASDPAAAAGRKDDTGKLRMDLIPVDALAALAEVLGFGARKYAPWNWAKGMAWSRLYAAAQRHLNSFWAGENWDEESGLPHLAHALCCITFLLVYQVRGYNKFDDRFQFPGQEPPEEVPF